MATAIEREIAEFQRVHGPLDASPEPTLTKKHAEVLRFIEQYIAEHGYAPSMRECGAAVKTRSTGYITYVLMRLEKLGYITRNNHVSRSIRVIKTLSN